MDSPDALSPEARITRAAMQLAEADGAFQAGDLPTAQTLYEAAATDYRAASQNGALADCLHQLGVLRQYAGAYAEAEPLLQESAQLAESSGNGAALARTLHQLGRSRLQSGDYAGADDYYAQSLSLKTTLGDRSGMAGTLHQMGMLRRLQGNRQEAAEYYGLALAINQRLSDWSGVGGTLAELARLRLDEGDYTAAIANAWQALSIFHGSSRPEAAYAALTILQARRAMNPAAFATAAEHAGLTREVIAEVEAAASMEV